VKKTLVIFVVALAFSAVIQLPARLLTDQLAAQLPVQLERVEGTLWKGSAQLSWQQVRNLPIQWRWQPRALLNLSLGWQLEHQEHQLALQFRPWQLQQLSAVELDANFALLAQLKLAPPLIKGQISGQVEDVQYAPCESSEGQVNIDNFVWLGLELGKLSAQISCADSGRYRVVYQNEHAKTRVNGEVVLGLDRSISHQLSATSDDEQARQQLSALTGQPAARTMQWRFQGQF